MKLTNTFCWCCAVVLALFCSPIVYGADLWMIGKDDQNFKEFAIAGKYANFSKVFPTDPVAQIGCVSCKTDWSYIHPGPADIWSGRDVHTFTIDFDLTELPKHTSGYELLVKGWGHAGAAPVFEVNLNGKTELLPTSQTARSDENLTNPQVSEPGSYKVSFPENAVKIGRNVLTLTSISGSWFLYDCIKFRVMSDQIEEIGVAPVRGIFRDPNGAARKIKVDYQGNLLSKPAWLNVEYTPEGSETQKQRFMLNPEEHGRFATVALPVSEADSVKSMQINVVLDVQGRKIDAKTELQPERKWEVHLIHQTHLDVGYTHTQVAVLERQVQSIRDALKYIEETKDYPEEAKFRFHPEGMWAVEEFFKRASDSEKEAFVKAARNKDLHLDGMYAQAMTGMYNDEELFELFSEALRFAKKYDIEIDSAMQTDVPGYTWGLASVLGKCGIKYMTMGPNGGHRVGRLYYWGDKPFYWVSPSGKEKILCYLLDTGYHQFHREQLGHRITSEQMFGILDGQDWLARTDTPRQYPYDMLPIRYGIEGDNGRPNRVLSDVIKEWNEEYLYPKLVMSRNSTFMKDFEKRYGSELPVVQGDITPYWEDGAASTSDATALNRRAKDLLLWAETLWAINNPKLYPEHLGLFDSNWTDIIMYDEHTWGAHNSISEPDSDFVKQQDDYKQAYANRAVKDAGKLTYYVDELQGFLEEPILSLSGATTDQTVANAEEGIISNGLLTLKVDPKTGAIVSLKRQGIETDLVNPGDDGNAGLNDYLYIIGRRANRNRARHEGGVMISAEQIPGGAVLRVQSPVPNGDSLTRVIYLRDNCDYVYITNVLDKQMERKPEGTFFGFPFNVPGGKWRVDTPWAIVEVEKDQLPGANRNFYCVQRFCNLANDDFGVDWVTIDVPMMQFAPVLFTDAWNKDLSQWREHIDPNGTLYSWVCNNHWETNYKAGQDGRLVCSYAIRPYLGKYDAAKSQHFARSVRRSDITSQLVKPDNANVVITRVKPCREWGKKADSPYGPGLFVRLYNPTDVAQTVSLDFFSKGESYQPNLYLSNPLEERLETISGSITIDPLDMIVIRAE
ncbi:MAG: polysaccharide lyase family protein [Thermoguttaceae bacterium]